VAEPWPEPNREYEASKLAKVGERPMLVFSGRLRRDAISRRRVRVQTGGDGGRLVYSLANPTTARST
jgi:hypothetical protein